MFSTSQLEGTIPRVGWLNYTKVSLTGTGRLSWHRPSGKMTNFVSVRLNLFHSPAKRGLGESGYSSEWEREREREMGWIENERLKGQVSNREAQNVKGTWRRTEEIKEWESSIIWKRSGRWWEGKRIQKGEKSRLMREGRRKLQNGRIRVSKFRLKGEKYFQEGSLRDL